MFVFVGLFSNYAIFFLLSSEKWGMSQFSFIFCGGTYRTFLFGQDSQDEPDKTILSILSKKQVFFRMDRTEVYKFWPHIPDFSLFQN